MDTLRERHPARHGMGHGNRPRQHHVISLDSQPWRLCLSSCWSRHANANTNRKSYGYRNANSYSDSDKYAYTCFKAYPHAESPSHASAQAVRPRVPVISDQ
jgi:hypothetical protein